MKNVTVSLDEETALRARLEAERRHISVSGLIRQLLTEHMGDRVSYEGAKSRYLARQGSELSKQGSGHPRREELHDRDLR